MPKSKKATPYYKELLFFVGGIVLYCIILYCLMRIAHTNRGGVFGYFNKQHKRDTNDKK